MDHQTLAQLGYRMHFLKVTNLITSLLIMTIHPQNCTMFLLVWSGRANWTNSLIMFRWMLGNTVKHITLSFNDLLCWFPLLIFVSLLHWCSTTISLEIEIHPGLCSWLWTPSLFMFICHDNTHGLLLSDLT